MEMNLEATFGVVPTQDDLEWVWEDRQDGVLLQDLLLSSVLLPLQKPSAVFVEPNGNVGNGYDDEITMDMNEWYTNNVEMNNYGLNIPKSMEPQQSVPPTNVIQTMTAQNYDGYNNESYYQGFAELSNTSQMPMDFALEADLPPVLNDIPTHPFLHEKEVNAFLNLT